MAEAAEQPGGVVQMKVLVGPTGLVPRKEAAKALNRKAKTLAEWRTKGIGPKPVDVGGRVFYRWTDIQAQLSGVAA